MSFDAHRWAWQQAGIGPMAKFVLCRLTDRVKEGEVSCFPSVSSLAADCEMGRRTVQRAIADLVEAGLISTEQRTGFPQVFTMMLDKVRRSDAGCATQAQEEEGGGAPNTTSGVRHTGAKGAPERRPNLKTNLPRELKERTLPSEATRRKASGSPVGDLFREEEPIAAVNGTAHVEVARAPRSKKEQLWQEAVQVLRGAMGWDDRKSRSFIGKLLRVARDNLDPIYSAIVEARDREMPARLDEFLMGVAIRAGKTDPIGEYLDNHSSPPLREV